MMSGSISAKLTAAVIAFTLLLLLQFVGTFIASQSALSGFAELHRRQLLSSTISRQRRITDSLAEIPGKPGLRTEDAARLYNLVHPEAEAATAAARELGAGSPDFAPILGEIESSLGELNRNAGLYFQAKSAPESRRNLLALRQFALEASEAEDTLQLAVEQDSNRLFESVYRQRYVPTYVALCLAFFFVTITLGAGVKFVRNLSTSIANLVEATRRVALGNLDGPAPVLTHDEIGALTMAFNSMMRELKETTVSREHFALIADLNSNLYREAQEAIRARDEFLSIASHELKTPLTSLSLQLQILIRQMRKQIEREQAGGATDVLSTLVLVTRIVTSAEAQSKKLASLLDDLLDLTRIRLGQLKLAREVTDLSLVIHDVVGRFEVEANQRGISISVRSPGPVTGEWDPMRIEQVISNLISNALKYGNGSPISIAVERDPGGESVNVIVSDGGQGIPPEMLGRIFERFERAGISSRKVSGLGLGLYICRQIVEAHGGSIRVESAPGKGTSFTVSLPVKDVRIAAA